MEQMGDDMSDPVQTAETPTEVPKEAPVATVNPDSQVPVKAKRTRRKPQPKTPWEGLAVIVLDQTGKLPVDPRVFDKETASKYAMIQGYTTLEQIRNAIKICEEKLATPGLSEQLQIEWMNALRGVMMMQQAALERLAHSADGASEKPKIGRPKNLPPPMPPIVFQQNITGAKADELKRVDSAKAISERSG